MSAIFDFIKKEIDQSPKIKKRNALKIIEQELLSLVPGKDRNPKQYHPSSENLY